MHDARLGRLPAEQCNLYHCWQHEASISVLQGVVDWSGRVGRTCSTCDRQSVMNQSIIMMLYKMTAYMPSHMQSVETFDVTLHAQLKGMPQVIAGRRTSAQVT